jgi:hypothetical protein
MRLLALAIIVLAVVIAGAAGASADTGLPPPDSPLPVIAAQYLKEISELKAHGISVRCVTFPHEGVPGFTVFGAARLRGHVLYLSLRYVCRPLAVAYRSAPIFTGHSQPTLPFSSVDAVETVAHEWFHTRGVESEERAECHAVQYTWKWLRRSDLRPTYLAAARRHLLDNSRRPPQYKVPANCLGPT